ncbi:Hypp4838 [Branchiostoma lanceolatum]|uniref:Hypp4838 protein n=1 Tax=Branchiostoma lanceolatum TaxID=7740 RepID=A0A8K0AAK2_BRALA|nr:Hypp4838 [Branchiostoma lanceolatum]
MPSMAILLCLLAINGCLAAPTKRKSVSKTEVDADKIQELEKIMDEKIGDISKSVTKLDKQMEKMNNKIEDIEKHVEEEGMSAWIARKKMTAVKVDHGRRNPRKGVTVKEVGSSLHTHRVVEHLGRKDGSGVDHLAVEVGADRLAGEDGVDHLAEAVGVDHLAEAVGVDHLAGAGEVGVDRLVGEDGVDHLAGAGEVGVDRMAGEDGVDHLAEAVGVDHLAEAVGVDHLAGAGEVGVDHLAVAVDGVDHLERKGEVVGVEVEEAASAKADRSPGRRMVTAQKKAMKMDLVPPAKRNDVVLRHEGLGRNGDNAAARGGTNGVLLGEVVGVVGTVNRKSQ